MKKQYTKPVIAITESALRELAEREQKLRTEEAKIQAKKRDIQTAWLNAIEKHKLNDEFHQDLVEYSQELQNWTEELEEEEARQLKHEKLNFLITAIGLVALSVNLVLLWGFLG